MTSKRRKMNDTSTFKQHHSMTSLCAGSGANSSSSSSSSSARLQSDYDKLEHSYSMRRNLTNDFEFHTEHSKLLLQTLNEMRDNESLCDYEIRVNGRSFYCHKCLLIAMSDFFKAMLTCAMKESREKFVELKGFQSTLGIQLVLDFIYTGAIDINFDNLLTILDSASHLQVNRVLMLCSEFLTKNMNAMNCVSILKIADTYSIPTVIDHTNNFISENIVEIYQSGSDQFDQLSYDQIRYLLDNDCLQVCCSEVDLFLMIVKWLETPPPQQTQHDDTTSTTTSTSNAADKEETDRLKYAPELVRYVRFMNMSAEELADKVETVEFMNTMPECNMYLMNAYKWHALPKRQPLIKSEQTKLRNQDMLVAVGETSLFVLNEAKQKWEVVANAPLEDNYPYPFSVITINNYLYVLGTRRSSSEEYRTCYRFSPRTLEWTQLAPLINDRSRFGLALIQNHIYIFGGFEGFKRSNRVYLNTIERYSIEQDTWEEFSADGPLMSCMASTSHDNLIYFGGGKNVNWSKVSDFYCINVETKETAKKASMLTARTTHQITSINGLIYLFGGFDEAGNGVLSIESYSIKSDQWSFVTSIPGVVSKTWPQSLGISNNRFYISVFTTPNTFKIIQKGYYYDIETNLWSEGPVINERARYCPTCCLAFPKSVYNFNNSFVSVKHNINRNNSNKLNCLIFNERNAIENNTTDESISIKEMTSSSSSAAEEYDDDEVEEIIEEEINYVPTNSSNFI